jgi:hypothetical protein
VRGSGSRPAWAGIALSALVLTITGCTHALPLGPTASAQRHLATSIVLQAVRSQRLSSAGSCPAGSAPLPAGASAADPLSRCYRRVGKPLTISSASVGLYQQPAGPQNQPATYMVTIDLPAASAAELAKISTKAYHSGDQVATIVVGRTWSVLKVFAPITGGHFEIPASGKNQAIQLERKLVPSS